MNQLRIACAVSCALAALGATLESKAAGFALHEQGASGLGNAYAGTAAVAEDATTVWWNPAGMARLAPGKHLSVGGTYIMPSTKFTNSGSTNAGGIGTLGGDGGDAGKSALIPSVFYAMDLNPKWNLGFAATVPFGLKTEYDPSWMGRFQGILGEVKTFNLNGSASYKFSDAASAGFGLSYQTIKINLKTAANYTAAGSAPSPLVGIFGAGIFPGLGAEGQNSTSVDGNAWGWNVGTLFNATPDTRIGIAYRSSLKYKMDGQANFSNVPATLAPTGVFATTNVHAELNTPDDLAFSAVHKLNDRVELLGDVTWTHWSRIKQVPIVRTSGVLSGQNLGVLTLNFRDAWRTSIGANYKLNSAWTLKAGVAYDQSPVGSATDRTVSLPDNDRYWLSAGARYQISQRDMIDFGYAYIKVRNADINQNLPAGSGTIVGSFKEHVNILGVQYQHTF
ncbi:MAG TPA: outer membrane protein transport protein [Burkholderiales bacterium]